MFAKQLHDFLQVVLAAARHSNGIALDLWFHFRKSITDNFTDGFRLVGVEAGDEWYFFDHLEVAGHRFFTQVEYFGALATVDEPTTNDIDNGFKLHVTISSYDEACFFAEPLETGGSALEIISVRDLSPGLHEHVVDLSFVVV